MASASSSVSSSVPALPSMAVNTSLLLLSNMSSMMTVKLDYGNYVIWKHQIEVILDTYSMLDVLDDSISVPDRFLKDSSGNFTAEVNPAFIAWKNREQAMFTFLNSTLSPAILAITVGQKSARGVWKVLEKRFASVSRSHVMSLRNELNAIKKGVDSIDGYFQKIKQARDKLVAVSVFMDDEELLHIILDGLPSEYDSFSSAIRTRSEVLSVEELNVLLNAEERVIKRRSNTVDSASMAMAARFQSQGFQQGRGGRHNNQRGRGRNYNHSFGGGAHHGNHSNYNQFQNFNPGGSSHSQTYNQPKHTLNQNSSQSGRPICQICGKSGHSALDCYHRMDFTYQGKHPPAKLASMVANAAQVHSSNAWLTDTGCSDHVTPNLSQLSIMQQPIQGSEAVTVGNGQDLPVTHIGNGELQTLTHTFRLDNILRVPDLTSNLLSVHKLCLQNNAFCYFDAHKFLIQDLLTGKILYKGLSKDGVYPIPSNPTLSSTSCFNSVQNSAFVTVKPHQIKLWHHRLGHPSSKILFSALKPVFHSISLSQIHDVCSSCEFCISAQMHRFHLNKTPLVSTSLLELVHNDVWGPSLLTSLLGFNYYVIFIDDYSRFT